MGSNFSGPSDSSPFVCKWQIEMHFQILLRFCRDCCSVDKGNRVVFVFPVGRVPGLTGAIWERKNLVRNRGSPFSVGMHTSMGKR